MARARHGRRRYRSARSRSRAAGTAGGRRLRGDAGVRLGAGPARTRRLLPGSGWSPVSRVPPLRTTAPAGRGVPATVRRVTFAQPLGVGGILDAAVALYRRRFAGLVAVASAVLLPAGVAQAFLAAETGGIDLVPLLDPASPSVPPGFDRFLSLTLVSLLVGTVASLLVQAACIRIFAGEYGGRPVGGPPALGAALRLALPVVAAGLLVGLGTGLGAFAFLVPGVWLWASWYVAVPALVVEGTGPVAALGRSFRLVRPRFWPVLGTALVPTVVAALASYTAGTVAALLVPGTGSSAAVVSSAAATLAAVLTVPFAAAVATATYVDLRVRTEGPVFDVSSVGLASPGSTSHPA